MNSSVYVWDFAPPNGILPLRLPSLYEDGRPSPTRLLKERKNTGGSFCQRSTSSTSTRSKLLSVECTPDRPATGQIDAGYQYRYDHFRDIPRCDLKGTPGMTPRKAIGKEHRVDQLADDGGEVVAHPERLRPGLSFQ